MTEKNYKLGDYVRWRPRSDGTHAVSFSVLEHVRPADWPPTISLPEMGPRHGSLNEAWFLRAVRNDAERLGAQLDEELRLAKVLSLQERRDLRALTQVYRNDERYLGLGDDARYRNRRISNIILEWSASRGHPEFEVITRPHINAMLRHYDDRPSEQLQIRSLWNVLGELAELIWKIPNPVKGMSWTPPTPGAVHLWTPDVVERYALGAEDLGQPGFAAFLRVQFFIGQRMNDAFDAKHGKQYVDGALGVLQGKTEKPVYIPLPKNLRDEIERVRLPNSDYLFNDADTGRRFQSTHGIMTDLRAHLLKVGDPVHETRTLRHSAVCEMTRLGLTEGQIASRTGHDLERVGAILDRYMLDRQGIARRAAIQQHVASGGSADDFIQDSAPAIQDYRGDQTKLKFYAGPGVRKPRLHRRRNAKASSERRPQWKDGGLTDQEVAEWGNMMGVD